MDNVWHAWNNLPGQQQVLIAGFVAAVFALIQPLRWVALWILCGGAMFFLVS